MSDSDDKFGIMAANEKRFSAGGLVGMAKHAQGHFDSLKLGEGDKAQMDGLLSRIRFNAETVTVSQDEFALLKRAADISDANWDKDGTGEAKSSFGEIVAKLTYLDRVREPGVGQHMQQNNNRTARNAA